MTDVEKYIQLLTVASTLGLDVLDLIKTHAQANLTPAQYAELQGRFDEDAERARKNAGL